MLFIIVYRRDDLRFFLPEGNRLDRADRYADTAANAPVRIYDRHAPVLVKLDGLYLAGLNTGFTPRADIRVNLIGKVGGPAFECVRIHFLRDQ